MSVSISVSDGGTIALARSILADYPKSLQRAVKRAAVDAMRSVRAEIPRLLNARYDISKADVRSHMQLRNVVEDGGMKVGLVITGKRLPIMAFSVIPNSPPPQAGIPVAGRQIVSSVVVRGSAVLARPNRFVARMRSGHTNIFFRTGKGKNGKGIDQEFRPAIPELIREHKTIRPAIEKKCSEVFTKALERTTRAELEKAK